MDRSRHEFLQVLGAASVAGTALARHADADADAATAQRGLHDIAPFGNVSLLRMADCHAPPRPIDFREPSVDLGLGSIQGQPPHLAAATPTTACCRRCR